MKNKVILLYFFALLIIICTISIIISQSSSPNDDLIGKWEEVSWNYEKAPQRQSKEINSNQLSEITKNLIIHEAEIWEFNRDGSAVLYGRNSNVEKITWTLKGRGHILKLNHKNSTEHYQLYQISDDKLVIHFHTDLQAKGIVKMTFQRKI